MTWTWCLGGQDHYYLSSLSQEMGRDSLMQCEGEIHGVGFARKS